MKVPHSTQTTILQLVDPAYAAAQEQVETRIWNFHFLSVFSATLRLGRSSAVVTGGGIREILFLSYGNSFNETTSILEGRVVKVLQETASSHWHCRSQHGRPRSVEGIGANHRHTLTQN